MSKIVIIPSSMESAMQRDLDALRDSLPEHERSIFESEREVHRQEIINFYADHGYYPSIGGVSKNMGSTVAGEVANLLDGLDTIIPCPTCGDSDCAGGLPCETGDGA